MSTIYIRIFSSSPLGNFNVNLLKPKVKGTVSSEEINAVKVEVRNMLQVLGTQNLIANLNEGLGGDEHPELVSQFIDSVHEVSEELIKKNVK